MLILVGALLVAGGLALSAQAQNNVVYAAEYNQSTNRFGTINLLNGNFTKISSFGNALINDIAYCPTNGTLYGISNTTALVTFNKTNGAITTIGSLVSGIESLAFRPSDGALFGATSSKLYTVNPTNGTATSVGSYGSPSKLGTTGQNIRFAQDGNLYVSNTSTNTDIYRINTTNGAATWMGEAVGYPYLILMNASSNMYGVYINLGSSTNPIPKLATFDLSSFVNGGTNADGSTHQITINLVGAGTNFPANFNFSGNIPQAVTNLTVPVSATGPSNQTVSAGSTAVFSTVASGTGPYNYAWSKNGAAISGQTNSSLTLNNVTTNDAATYSVIVGGAMGTVTNSATLTVTKASATITLGSLSQTYDGAAKPATATTIPTGLTVTFTYNGSATVPISAGSYTVVATINDANYQGSATNTLVINKASSSIVLGSLSQTYNGAAKPATATTVPSGLTVSFTYNGSATIPISAGSYTVVATINDANYQGSATNTLVIAQASGSITLGSLSQTYTGAAKPATATTIPTGLTVNFTYNGSATVPTNAGSYTVIGTINDANYQGSATNTLVIAQAGATVTLGNLNQTYTGAAKPATATTIPTGLTVNFTYNGSATVPTNAGSYTVIGTINDANYQGSATNTLVIAQAGATVTLGNLNQTYTGAAKPATATTIPTGLTVNFTYNGSANVPTNVGSYTVIGMINDANYQGGVTNTLVINAATLTYTANAASLTYGSAVPGLSGLVSGFVGTDNQGNATTGTLTFTTTATSFSGVGGYAINGAGLTANNGNYTFVQAAGNATALTINALPVNLAGTRSYDGTTTAAAGILSVANKVGSDNVTVASGSGTLAGVNVGSEAITSFGTLALGGTAAGNYTLAGANGSVNITVSALALTVTNLLALDKVYDGTTNATLDATNAGLTGMLNSDDVTLVTSNAVAYFADKNVSTNKPVTVTGLALDGAAAANYTLVDPTNVTANITAAGLTVSGVTAVSKVYDGTTNAQLNGTATLNGVVSGDDVSLATDDASAAFASPNVGPGVPVTVSGYAITGADAGNYILTQPSALAADITAATLTITATANAKIYDGTTSAVAIPTTSGLQGSDTVTGLVETYDTPDAGTSKTLSVSAFTVNDGNGGNNYTVSTVTSTAGVINKALSLVSLGGLSQTYSGSAETATATTIPTGLAVTFTYNGSATIPTAAGNYTVIGTINDANYQGSATGTLAIGQASGAVTLGNLSQTYDGAAKAATAVTTPTGLAVTFTYNGSATIPTAAGTYTVVATINDANYQGSATGTLVIDKASATVALGSLSQTYDGAAKAATATTTPTGLTVSFTYNGSATIPTAAGSYTVVGTINDANYQGSATSTLVIDKASAAVTLGSLSQTYDGAAKAATATTTPTGLTVSFTYNGSATIPTAAGSYTVVGTINDANYQGSATSTLVIDKASAAVTLGSLSQTYDGAAKAATATTTPTGLTVSFTYNGSATVPTSAGSYTLVGTISDANYQGSATGTLVIAQASGAVTLGNLSQTYDGTAKAATAGTTPSGLTVALTYNGSANAPTNAGSYTVIGTINDANYQGSATNTLVIAQAPDEIVFGSLNQTYSSTAKPVTASTTPTGLTVSFTYNGSANAPTNAGSYTVIGMVNDANYQGSATNTLVINKAVLTVTADNKTKLYGMSNPPLTASYNGFVGGENASVLLSPVVLNTTATTTCGVGNYPITASDAAAANYTIQYVDGILQVIASPQLTGANVSVNGKQQFVVSWQTFTNQTYQLECTVNLTGATWAPVGGPVAGTGTMVSVTNSISVSPQCFFRVQVQ